MVGVFRPGPGGRFTSPLPPSAGPLRRPSGQILEAQFQNSEPQPPFRPSPAKTSYPKGVLPEDHFGLLWETWCLGFGVLWLGSGVWGLGFAVLELGFVVLALKPRSPAPLTQPPHSHASLVQLWPSPGPALAQPWPSLAQSSPASPSLAQPGPASAQPGSGQGI